jgi:molecular chaperone DnaK
MDFTPLRIRLPFGSEEEFIARYGVHVGRDGFFLVTRTPKEVGARLAFELVLADGRPLLSGDGEVAQSLTGARSGMVVRFLRLHGDGASLVERILAARRAPEAAEGGVDSEATTWLGDPTRDVARISSPHGAQKPGAPAAQEPPREARAGKKPLASDEAPTWPGDPTRDVVRFLDKSGGKPAASPEGQPRPLARSGPIQPPAPVARPPEDVPFHLRPTPALGIPETQAVLQTLVHTAVTPVRGIPALGPEVVAFLANKSPALAKPPPEPLAPSPAAPVPAPQGLEKAADEEDTRAQSEPADEAPREAMDATPVPTGEALDGPRTLPQDVPAPPEPPRAEAPTLFSVPPRAETPAPALEAIPLPAPALEAIPLPAPATLPPPPARPAQEKQRVAPDGADAAEAVTPAGQEARPEAVPLPLPAPTPRSASVATTEPGLAAAVLGLDVGTEFARMAWAPEGRAEALPTDAEGGVQALLLRLVRDAHGVLRLQQPGEPEEALWVGSPVTLLGTRADSPAIRTLVRRWPVPVVADERGEVAFDWAGVTVTAVELVAVLLRSLRGAAERRTGRSFSQAVLVVPAAFTLLQRARFREAAERAGLNVLRLLNAPTAAALAYAQGRGMARKRVLVWRMGAATCDAAVVAVSGNDLDVVSSGGDGALGGVNFDEQLALGLDKTARSDPARLRLRVAQAERCKQSLSTSERALVPPAVAGEPVVEVGRPDLEMRTAALVERSVLLALEVLRAANVSPENLDALVLSGGMAQLPHVRRAVEAAFAKTAATDADEACGPALGAALLGAALSAPAVSGRARSNVVEVLGVPLEAVAPEFGHQRAFERNTRLPAEKTLPLTLPSHQPLEVQLFQGVARAPDPRSFLGLLQSGGVERAGEWALHLGLSADGLLQAGVTPPGGKRRALTLAPAPAPAETEAEEASPDETEPGSLLGGLKRLFSKK